MNGFRKGLATASCSAGIALWRDTNLNNIFNLLF